MATYLGAFGSAIYGAVMFVLCLVGMAWVANTGDKPLDPAAWWFSWAFTATFLFAGPFNFFIYRKLRAAQSPISGAVVGSDCVLALHSVLHGLLVTGFFVGTCAIAVYGGVRLARWFEFECVAFMAAVCGSLLIGLVFAYTPSLSPFTPRSVPGVAARSRPI